MLRKILEQINYGHRDETDTDAKLIWMHIQHAYRKFDNFKDLIERAKTNSEGYHYSGFHLDSILPKPLAKKYSRTIVLFGHNPHNTQLASYYQTPDTNAPKKSKKFYHVIQFSNLTNLSQENISNTHPEILHKDFLYQLGHNYDTFRHEFQHLVDFRNKDMSGLVNPNLDMKGYLNQPHEMSAFTAQRTHQIHRMLLRNDKTDDDTGDYTELPLRERLYHYRTKSFADKLKLISSHGINSSENHIHDWYSSLTPENQKSVEEKLHPIINKYMVPNKPKVMYK